MTTRIEQLRSIPIRGNAHDDRERLALAVDIITDESESFADRFAAVAELDRTMGEPTILDGLDVEAFVRRIAFELTQ